MRLLLDENLPHELRHELPGHDCVTVAYMKWAGVKNGALLARAAAAGIDALLTKDGGMKYEQNLSTLPLAIVALRAASNDIEDIRPLIPSLLKVLADLRPNAVTHVP